MDYQEFLDFIKENLLEYYKEISKSEEVNHSNIGLDCDTPSDDCEINIVKVVKNNGIVLDAVVIYQAGEKISPNIYLKPYYDGYQMGKPLDFILTEIVCQYIKEKNENHIEFVDLDDFTNAKNNIVFRLINYERNKEMLKDCPYKRYLDLAITFRYMIMENPIGTASVLITDSEYERWNITLDELYNIALFNTIRDYPWQMEPLSDIVFDCFEDRMADKLSDELYDEIIGLKKGITGVNLFILSNNSKAFGSNCMLYDNVIKNFSKVQDANIFILPSSVHEVMLVPESDETEPEFLYDLLIDANKTSVGLIDLLSDNLYYYDREKDSIDIFNID